MAKASMCHVVRVRKEIGADPQGRVKLGVFEVGSFATAKEAASHVTQAATWKGVRSAWSDEAEGEAMGFYAAHFHQDPEGGQDEKPPRLTGKNEAAMPETKPKGKGRRASK